MPDQTLQIRGIAELQRALYEYNKRLGDRVTGMAVRLGANYMLKQVRANTPVSPNGSMIGKKGGPWVRGKPGRLKAAVKVKASRINRRAKNGVVGVYLTVNPGKKRDDTKGAWYGKFVEVGHTYRGRTTTGRHFVLSTFNSTKQQSAEIIINASELALRQVAAELNLQSR